VRDVTIRSQLLDGPLQRQILLMKLIHEIENRPVFPTQLDRSPDGASQLWLAHIGALLKRVSIEKGAEFNAAMRTSIQYWSTSVNSILLSVRAAIEELKLEFDLYQDDLIGRIYEADQSHRFKTDLLDIFNDASNEVFVVDPYFDATIFKFLFENNANFSIRVLCSQYYEAVEQYRVSFVAQHSRIVKVRKSKALHDRAVFVDDDCWIVGASLKDAGKKPTYLMPLAPPLGIEKKRIYEEIWSRADGNP
jgi:hypothetical protein